MFIPKKGISWTAAAPTWIRLFDQVGFIIPDAAAALVDDPIRIIPRPLQQEIGGKKLTSPIQLSELSTRLCSNMFLL